MRLPGSRLASVFVMCAALASAALLIAVAPAARAAIGTVATPTASPSPPPTPTPVNAFISLDVTAGDANTLITVNGSAFLANESTSLYWDQPSHVSGGVNADANGNFTTKVKPYPGDPPGVHKLCASVPPSPCASFSLQAAATSPSPTASPSPSPDASPSPTASPTDSPSPTPVAAKLNGLNLIMKPPFVILPIIAGLGLLIALAYWIISIAMRPRQQQLKSVAVAHLATRPDYTAGFGAPPPAPAPPAQQPSAWADVHPPTPAPTSETPETPLTAQAHEVAPPGPVDETPRSDTGYVTPASPDEPPDLPEPGDD